MQIKSLCSPVLALMRRMTYGRLFTLVGALLVAPMAVLLYLQVSGTNAQVVFNQKEIYGVDNIEPARSLMSDLTMRRVQVAAASQGVTEAADQANAAKSRVREHLSALLQTSQRLAHELTDANGSEKTAVRAKELAAAVLGLDQKSDLDPAALDAAHQEVLGTINDFVLNYVANYSNLILDPDLDSYWLMDAYTGRLASLSSTLSSISTRVMLQAREGRLEDKQRLTLAAEIEAARTLVRDLRTNFTTAFDNTKSADLRSTLDPKVSGSLGTVDGYLGLVEAQFLGAQQATNSTADTYHAAGEAVAATHELYRAVGPQLHELIRLRVDSYERARLAGLAAGFVAVLLVIYIMLAFYFQVASELTSKIREAEELRSKAEAENSALNGNIMDLLTFVADCADGDLTAKAKVTEGALGNVADALNQMMDNWTNVLGTLIKTIEETTSAGQKIGAAAEGMASGATQQVQKLEGATTAVQQIRGNITHVSDNAATAVTAASRTQESAFNGAEMVQKIAEEMDTLRSNVQAGAKKIKNLGDRSMEITGIVATIAKISEQTNMLALNAAIEAARAGEHGRGFSVVAEEVRKLAERTSAATQDIRTLISSIQAETSESVAAIEEQTRAVEHHAESVTHSGEVLQKIQHESTQTSELIADMNRTAKDQVPVAEQTLQSMLSVSEIARSTQNSAHQTLELSQELGEAANRLVSAISSFKIAR